MDARDSIQDAADYPSFINSNDPLGALLAEICRRILRIEHEVAGPNGAESQQLD